MSGPDTIAASSWFAHDRVGHFCILRKGIAVVPVTATTPWKTTGDTDVEALRTEFATRGIPGPSSPLVAVAAEVLGAASPYSRLLAAMSWLEQKHATNVESTVPAEFHNFL